jgi:hypothetical protein
VQAASKFITSLPMRERRLLNLSFAGGAMGKSDACFRLGILRSLRGNISVQNSIVKRKKKEFFRYSFCTNDGRRLRSAVIYFPRGLAFFT